MADNKNILDQVMGLLSPIGGITSRSMFGGYGIFHEGDMFALLKGTGVFFKVDESNRADYEKAGSKQYKPMPYFQVPESILADAAHLQEWARASIKISHTPAVKKKQR